MVKCSDDEVVLLAWAAQQRAPLMSCLLCWAGRTAPALPNGSRLERSSIADATPRAAVLDAESMRQVGGW